MCGCDRALFFQYMWHMTITVEADEAEHKNLKTVIVKWINWEYWLILEEEFIL